MYTAACFNSIFTAVFRSKSLYSQAAQLSVTIRDVLDSSAAAAVMKDFMCSSILSLAP
jgi:hypothetical protein